MRTTNATFSVEGLTGSFKIDGRSEGTLIVEAPKPSGVVLVTFRPKRGREYTLTLPEVCAMIASRVSKKEAS